MCGENLALMRSCALSLNIEYILKSQYSISKHINYLLKTLEYRNPEGKPYNFKVSLY